jgi:hypothetical protein
MDARGSFRVFFYYLRWHACANNKKSNFSINRGEGCYFAGNARKITPFTPIY